MTTNGSALIFEDGRGRWIAPGDAGYPGGTDWVLTDLPAGIVITQGVDVGAVDNGSMHRVDLFQNTPGRRAVLNLNASVAVAFAGTPTSDIIVDLSALILGLHVKGATWVQPDIGDVLVAGYLSVNDAGPFILRRVGVGQLAPTSVAGGNIGNSVFTLAPNDVVSLNLMAEILDSD